MATWSIEKSISSDFEVLDGEPPRKSKLPHAVIVSGTTREKPEKQRTWTGESHQREATVLVDDERKVEREG